MKKLLFGVLALLCVACTPSEKETSAILDKGFAEIMEKHDAVGLMVAAVKDGEVVYNVSYGYKDFENKVPVGIDDKLRIASISKTFVATAVMQLVEQGKINLDEDISNYMGFELRNPNFPDIPITVRMLLSHTSSMSDANGYFSFDYFNPAVSPTWQKAWNSYQPGTKYQYCNLGFNTLGAIIEIVSGERFDIYIKKHIFEPLGVEASHNVMDFDPSQLIGIYRYDASTGSFEKSDAYAQNAADLENYKMGYSTPVFSPTGGVKISAKDLAKVMIMHMNKGAVGDVRIISQESSSLMQSEITPTNYEGECYGMAMISTNDMFADARAVGHDGLALGAYTAMYWVKDGDFGVVVMTNGCTGKTDKAFANILCESAQLLKAHLNK